MIKFPMNNCAIANRSCPVNVMLLLNLWGTEIINLPRKSNAIIRHIQQYSLQVANSCYPALVTLLVNLRGTDVMKL